MVTDAAGSELDRLAASTDLRALAFGFSDELFAGASASELAIHRDAEAGDRERIDSLTVPYTGGIMAVAVDPAGDRVVVASWDGSIQAFSPTTLSPLTEAMQGHDGTPRRVGFSPDGGLLASVGNNALQLWDASSLRPVGGPIRGDNTPIWDIAFSPDAALLAMAGGSGAIVLVTISEREWRKRACTLARRELSLREVAQYFPPGMGVPSICGEPGEGR